MADNEDRLDPLKKLQEGPETELTPRAIDPSAHRRQEETKDEVFTSEEAVLRDQRDVGRFGDYAEAVPPNPEEICTPDVPSTSDYH